MDLGLAGKRAVVAAASSGLGYSIAEQLGAAGARVAICSRDAERAELAAERIRTSTGAEVMSAAVDVADSDQIGAWLDAVAATWDGLYVVVPNAGGPPSGAFADTDEAQWDAAYRLTLRSALAFARFARPHLGRGASVLFMTSSSVKEPVGVLALSNVFRAGVAALAKTLAREWAPAGIRVNHLIPGRIATDRVALLDAYIAEQEGISQDAVQQRSEASIPLGRYGDPEEYAAAAVFLLSNAASYVTGSTLQVDGGAIRGVL